MKITKQRGVGLIEVLISLVVLSIGMLGIAGLQVWSLRNNQGAMERSMAVVETHSIVDAMRADRANALAGSFNSDDSSAVEAGTSFATQSLATWQANLERSLGSSAKGAVDCSISGTSAGVCTIRVVWTDGRSVGSSTDRQRTSPEQQVETVVHL
jgi:type IV pilus assembly protein PilV